MPTHDLAQQVQQELEIRGVSTHYWRQGPDEADACPKRDMVEFFRGLGYVIRRGPCADCPQRRSCAYRKVFTCRANRQAQVLILTSWHLRRRDLWRLKALTGRPLVVLDEDALSALAAPVELSVDRLRSFLDHLPALREELDPLDEEDLQADWLRGPGGRPLGPDPALVMMDTLGRGAQEILRSCATAGSGQWQPSERILAQVVAEQDESHLADNQAFWRLVRCAYQVARSRRALPNLLDDLRELLREGRPVHLSLGGCRWTQRASIPSDRQVVLLDATAEPLVVEGVLGRAVEVIDTPVVHQQASIYQIMDKIGTRAGNRRDLEREESWTVQLVTTVARRHRGQSLLCVTFKNDQERLTDLLEREHGGATVIHYGALRGLNSF